MGEPPGTEYADGNNCAHCWGLGKPFGDVTTPLYIYVTITGLAGGCAGGNDVYVAKQDSIVPCHFAFRNETHSGYIEFRAVDTVVFLQRIFPPLLCINNPAPACFIVWNFGAITVVLS